MISFLAPLYLLAAAAIAVPLLIHLLRRRIGTKVEFPAVRYLARAEREHSRKLRLRNLLLMLVRVAAVVLLAAAAARPVARVAGSGHAPTSLAIVLDNSLSTAAIVRGRSVLEDLRARAAETARRASAEDRLWLVTADGTVHGGNRAAVLDAIERAEPLTGAGDLSASVRRALSLVRAGTAVEREIAVITDGQATSWRPRISVGRVRVALFRTPAGPPPNHAVVEASATPVRWTPRGAVAARVLTPDSSAYRIALEGRTLARGSVLRDDAILVRAAPAERGWTAGTVELEPDELRADNVRHFAAWIGPAPSVAVDAPAGMFTRSAVDALIQAERAVAGDEIEIASADEVRELPALLVAPSDPVRVGAANRSLERLAVPWRFGRLRRVEGGARVGGPSAATGRPLDGVAVSQRYALIAQPGARTDTLATAGGEAWIVGGPRYVLVGSPLTPDATTLPLRAGFLPWLGDVIGQSLSGEGGSVVVAPPGSPVARPAAADGFELPTGQRTPLAADTITAPERAGVYFFLRGDRRVGALAVNAEPEESVLERLGTDSLRARLAGPSVRVVTDTAAWRGATFASAPQRPITVPLLALALGALLAESLLAGSGRRRRA